MPNNEKALIVHRLPDRSQLYINDPDLAKLLIMQVSSSTMSTPILSPRSMTSANSGTSSDSGDYIPPCASLPQFSESSCQTEEAVASFVGESCRDVSIQTFVSCADCACQTDDNFPAAVLSHPSRPGPWLPKFVFQLPAQSDITCHTDVAVAPTTDCKLLTDGPALLLEGFRRFEEDSALLIANCHAMVSQILSKDVDDDDLSSLPGPLLQYADTKVIRFEVPPCSSVDAIRNISHCIDYFDHFSDMALSCIHTVRDRSMPDDDPEWQSYVEDAWNQIYDYIEELDETSFAV